MLCKVAHRRAVCGQKLRGREMRCAGHDRRDADRRVAINQHSVVNCRGRSDGLTLAGEQPMLESLRGDTGVGGCEQLVRATWIDRIRALQRSERVVKPRTRIRPICALGLCSAGERTEEVLCPVRITRFAIRAPPSYPLLGPDGNPGHTYYTWTQEETWDTSLVGMSEKRMPLGSVKPARTRPFGIRRRLSSSWEALTKTSSIIRRRSRWNLCGVQS
jgi:hypothetical protein